MNRRLIRATATNNENCAALTLVEVTVTIVALTMLTAWLLPPMASVARNSKEGRCLSNLGQIGYASLFYAAEDPSGWVIPAHWLQFRQDQNNPTFIGAYEWGGKSGVGRPCYVPGPCEGEFGFLTSKYGTRAGFGPATRALNFILYPQEFPDFLDPSWDRLGSEQDTRLELDIYTCPSDTGYTGAHCTDFASDGRSSYDHFGNSYTANIFMIAGGGGGEMKSNSPYLRPLSRIVNPRNTLAYQENNGRWAWAVAPQNPDCEHSQSVSGPVGSWHGKDWTFGATFVDGHADWIYMRGYRNPRVFQDQEEQEDWHCIIVRGDGWQKDTLPAALIPTGLWHGGSGRASYEDCFEGG